jgi:hypothetical protein
MATNPTLEGDGTALYIANLLQDSPVRITRLARGIPTGSILEFANKEMLADALTGRQSFRIRLSHCCPPQFLFHNGRPCPPESCT